MTKMKKTKKTKNRHANTYEAIGARVRVEAVRLDAEHTSWEIIDLNDGDVVTLVWFGTTAKMKKFQRQLETFPKVDLAFLSHHASSDKIIAAIRTSLTDPSPGTNQKTLKKLQRSAR
jgi:hypothetical protein